MKTQIKQWGDSKVLVLSSDFMKFHNARVGYWIDLSEVVVINLLNKKEDQLQNLKENFPNAYASHIKEFPGDAE